MLIMRDLMAIPYPAPSIAPAYPLYHGGCEYRGMLQSAPRDVFGETGGFVYFATLRSYAQTHIRSARSRGTSHAKRAARLYVVDARALPPGARVMDAAWRSVPRNLLLCDIVDLRSELHRMRDEALDRRRSDAPALDSPFGRAGLWRLAGCGVPVRRHDDPANPMCLNAVQFSELVLLQEALGIARSMAVPPAMIHDWHDHEGAPIVIHRFYSAALFAQQFAGTLRPDISQIDELIRFMPRHWLATFTQPVTRHALPAARDRAEWARITESGAGTHERPNRAYPEADGSIVLVPGPIPVLARGWTGIDRSARRHATRIRQDRG
jgi:hypothetical protein